MSDDDIFDVEDDGDVDLSPENKPPSNRVDRFKGEAGTTYRIGLVMFHSLEKSLVLSAKKKAKKAGAEIDKAEVLAAIKKALEKRATELGKSVDELTEADKLDTRKVFLKKYVVQYKEGVGMVQSRLGKDGSDADKYWRMLEDPTTYYGCIGIIYSTDRNGNVDKETLMSRTYVAPLRLTEFQYGRLIEVEQKLKGLPGGAADLTNMDLTFTCKKIGKGVTFDIDFASESIWRKASKIRDKFLPQAVAMYDKAVDAREISTTDLMVKLGVGKDSGEDVSDDEMDDLLEDV